MSKKAKLSQLHQELTGTNRAEKKSEQKATEPKQEQRSTAANPTRGERGDFLKVTITLPPDMLASVKKLGIERQLKGMRDTGVSNLIREALANFLDSQG